MVKTRYNIIDASHIFTQTIDYDSHYKNINDDYTYALLEHLYIIVSITKIIHTNLLSSFYSNYGTKQKRNNAIDNLHNHIQELKKLSQSNFNFIALLSVIRILSKYLKLFNSLDKVRNCRFNRLYEVIDNHVTNCKDNSLLQKPKQISYKVVNKSCFEKLENQINVCNTDNFLSMLIKQIQELILAYLPVEKVKILYVKNHIAYAKKRNVVQTIYDFTEVNILPLISNRRSSYQFIDVKWAKQTML